MFWLIETDFVWNSCWSSLREKSGAKVSRGDRVRGWVHLASGRCCSTLPSRITPPCCYLRVCDSVVGDTDFIPQPSELTPQSLWMWIGRDASREGGRVYWSWSVCVWKQGSGWGWVTLFRRSYSCRTEFHSFGELVPRAFHVKHELFSEDRSPSTVRLITFSVLLVTQSSATDQQGYVTLVSNCLQLEDFFIHSVLTVKWREFVLCRLNSCV